MKKVLIFIGLSCSLYNLYSQENYLIKSIDSTIYIQDNKSIDSIKIPSIDKYINDISNKLSTKDTLIKGKVNEESVVTAHKIKRGEIRETNKNLNRKEIIRKKNESIKKIGKKDIEHLINKEFGNLFNPQSNNIIGNFASLDLGKSEISFAGNFFINNSAILGIKASGASNNKNLAIFSNNSFNSKVAFDAQLNLLALKNRTIHYSYDEYQSYLQTRRNLNETLLSELITIKNNEDSIKLEYEIKTIKFHLKEARIDSIKLYLQMGKDTIEILKDIRALEIKIEKLDSLISTEIIPSKKDSLNITLAAEKVELSYTNSKFKNYHNNFKLKVDSFGLEIAKYKNQILIKQKKKESALSEEYLVHKVLKKKNTAQKSAFNNIKLNGFFIGWFSIGGGLSNHSFSYFNIADTLTNPVKNKNSVNFELRTQYSLYKYRSTAYRSFFMGFGVTWSITDNHDDLEEISISERTQIGAPIGDRYIVNNYNADTGLYNSYIDVGKIYFDGYYFLFKNNQGAIHLYPEYIVKEGTVPMFNIGFGFLLTFKDKDKNNLNSEIYMNLMDIPNNHDSENKLFKRSYYGVRFTIPIRFK